MTPSNICVMNSHAACCEDDHIILDDKHENKWKKDPWRTVQDHRDLRKDLPKTPQSISEAARNTQFTQQRSHTVSSAKHCQGSSLGFVWFGALKFKAVRSREQQTWRQHSEVFLSGPSENLHHHFKLLQENLQEAVESAAVCKPDVLALTHSDLMGFIRQGLQFKEVHSWKTQWNLV